jgi:hypothetical protein
MRYFKLVVIALGILACTSSAKAQGMQPKYTYTQLVYWLPGSSNAIAVEVGISVLGNTSCYPLECPIGVTHHSDLFAGIGNEGAECVGPNEDPQDTIEEQCVMAIALPFYDQKGSVWGEIICSQRGTISSDQGYVEGMYWENQVTFVKALPNSSNITTDCTYPNDTSPDWAGYGTNPYGTQGSTPNPAIIEEMRIAYTANSSGYAPFTQFPNGYDEFSGVAMDYGPWSGSMPQVCTQHASGKTRFTPTWQANP